MNLLHFKTLSVKLRANPLTERIIYGRPHFTAITQHAFVTINGIEIDEELAPLITKIWETGISTKYCCQEIAPGLAHIIFPTSDDAIRFIEETNRLLGGWPAHSFLFEVIPGGYNVGWKRKHTTTITAVWHTVSATDTQDT